MQFSEVRIPPAVAAELKDHPNKMAGAAIEAALGLWIHLVTPNDTPLRRMLRRQVDPGEAEATALAYVVQNAAPPLERVGEEARDALRAGCVAVADPMLHQLVAYSHAGQ